MALDVDAQTHSSTGAQVAVRGYTAMDVVFAAYLAINSAWLLLHARQIVGWPALLAANALAVVLVRLLARAPLTPTARFVGGAYPALLTMGYYAQLGIVNTALGHVHDHAVQRWELALFAAQVSVNWHHAMPNAALSFVLHLCYGSYYWLVPFALIWLFARHSHETFERAGFVVALAFYLSYACFLLFPVAGPRYFFGPATGPAAEVFTARVVHAVLAGGSAWGTAFPSSHVAVAWCAVWSLWQEARPTALVLAPIALGVPFGTVYGQFHYGVDALAGVLLAVLLCALADPLRRALRPASPRSA